MLRFRQRRTLSEKSEGRLNSPINSLNMVTAVRCSWGTALTKTNVKIIRLRNQFNVAINPSMTQVTKNSKDFEKGSFCYIRCRGEIDESRAEDSVTTISKLVSAAILQFLPRIKVSRFQRLRHKHVISSTKIHSDTVRTLKLIKILLCDVKRFFNEITSSKKIWARRSTIFNSVNSMKDFLSCSRLKLTSLNSFSSFSRFVSRSSISLGGGASGISSGSNTGKLSFSSSPSI